VGLSPGYGRFMVVSQTSLPAQVLKFQERVRPQDGSFRLTVVCEAAWPICTLSLLGSLDSDSSVALDTQYDQIGCGSFAEVVLDIEGLTNLDSNGAASLYRLERYVWALGGTARFRGSVSPAISKYFEISAW
jgi:anti-anti-sigma regulatory factor